MAESVPSVPSGRLGAKAGRGSKNPKRGLVFEAGYNDGVLVSPSRRAAALAYILDNPRRLWVLVHHSERLRAVELVDLHLPPLGPEGGTPGAGSWISYWDGPHGERPACLLPAPPDDPRGATFHAIGNRDLLQAPWRRQIQASRSMTADEQRRLVEATLLDARQGLVAVSPCISPGERAVARALLDARLPFVALLPQGIPLDLPQYKPYKAHFDACAEGRLLLLSPFRREEGPHHARRWQCLLLNELAARLTLTPHVNTHPAI